VSAWTARAHEQRQAQAACLAAVLRDADPIVLERAYRATAAGDSRKLRGIPAIGRGVAGAVNGTSPHAIR
jgi:hypothetical protein